MLQYFLWLWTRKLFPHFIITRKTREHASPINAAEIKQFWYPKPSTHGVILSYTSVIFSNNLVM